MKYNLTDQQQHLSTPEFKIPHLLVNNCWLSENNKTQILHLSTEKYHLNVKKRKEETFQL